MNQAEFESEVKDSISADQVHDFLRENLDFFAENSELLELLKIPHPSGQAVSLVTKQLEIYRAKKRETAATTERVGTKSRATTMNCSGKCIT